MKIFQQSMMGGWPWLSGMPLMNGQPNMPFPNNLIKNKLGKALSKKHTNDLKALSDYLRAPFTLQYSAPCEGYINARLIARVPLDGSLRPCFLLWKC